MIDSIPFLVSYAALWIVVVLQGVLLFGLVRITYQLQQGVRPSPLNAKRLGRGAPAPAFSAATLTGEVIGTETFLGKLTALLFVSPNCPSCMATLYEMEALEYKTKGNLRIVCRGSEEECAQLAFANQVVAPVIADAEHEISRSYGISSVPTAVLIDETGHIHSYGEPKRGEEVGAMLEHAHEHLAPAEA